MRRATFRDFRMHPRRPKLPSGLDTGARMRDVELNDAFKPMCPAQKSHCPWPAIGAVLLALLLVAGSSCRRAAESDPAPADVRGKPIAQGTPATGTVAAAAGGRLGQPLTVLTNQPEVMDDGFLRLGFDRLSAFKFEVYEVYSETNAGRPLLRSDDKIPPWIQAYDGRAVTVRGFVLPLRLKKGRATEFLLLRDQGTCCFGPQAQINHFMRVKFPAGAETEQAVPYRVRGTLHVGEVYVQGYLTGIYNLDAVGVERSAE